jgi:hypothetical protein
MKRCVCTAMPVLACTPSGSSWAGPSLRAKGEAVFFSSPATARKIVSLCGRIAGENGAEGGGEWLQYRFGRPGAIELNFPQTKQDSLSKFKGANPCHLPDAVIPCTSKADTRDLFDLVRALQD